MSQVASILIIDTSQPTVWVAVIQDGKILDEREWLSDKALGVKLLEVIEELRGKGRIKRIAVHVGPGHFMATRTGVVVAQLLAGAWQVEIVSVSGQERADVLRGVIMPNTLDTLTTLSLQ